MLAQGPVFYSLDCILLFIFFVVFLNNDAFCPTLGHHLAEVPGSWRGVLSTPGPQLPQRRPGCSQASVWEERPSAPEPRPTAVARAMQATRWGEVNGLRSQVLGAPSRLPRFLPFSLDRSLDRSVSHLPHQTHRL